MIGESQVPVPLLFFVAGFAVMATGLALARFPLYWGHRLGSSGVPMSATSRGLFAAAPWFLTAMLLAEAFGSRLSGVAVFGFVASVISAIVSSMIDFRRHRTGPAATGEAGCLPAGEQDVPDQVRRMVTRFSDIQNLDGRGILRSVVIMFHSDVESYRHLLKSPEGLRSLEKLRALPPDVFDNEACTAMLVEEGYQEAFEQLGMPRSELIPCLIERIEGDQEISRGLRSDADDGSVSSGITWYTQHLVARFLDLRAQQPETLLPSVLILLHSRIESYRHLLDTRESRASLERLRSLPPDAFDSVTCSRILKEERYAKLLRDLDLSPSELIPVLLRRVEGEGSDSSPPGPRALQES